MFPDGTTITQNGAFQAVQGARFADITDGLTNTLLVGEKNTPMSVLGSPPWDCGIFDGHNPMCSNRPAGAAFPLSFSNDQLHWSFGSWHPGICQFVYCDGSVRPLANSINPVVLGLLAQRNDGQPVLDY